MDASQLSQDLHFVRQAVAKSERPQPRPAPVFFYWSAYVLVGFALVDFAPAVSGWFFLIGTIIGMIFSGIVARRTFARFGQHDPAAGKRGFLHWFGGMCIAVIGPVVLANLDHSFNGQLVGQVSVIMIGLVYFMAGVHLDRPFLWMGLLLVVGGVCLGLVPHYGWTILGVLLAGALFITGLLGPFARPIGARIPEDAALPHPAVSDAPSNCQP